MKCSINQAELLHALNIVKPGISSNVSLPILNGVLICAQNNKLILQTTDLKLSCQYQVEALVEDEGSFVISYKVLYDIVKTLDDASVHILVKDGQVHISCNTASFALSISDADEYPAFPEFKEEESLIVNFETFTKLVRKVSKFASKDTSSPILTGVLVSKEDQTLKMVATDRYRLAIVKTEGIAQGSELFEAVISASFLVELAGLIKSTQDIKIALNENQIIIKFDDTILINRRIEGNYVNYRQLIPQNFSTIVTCDCDKLKAAIRRVIPLASELPYLYCDFDPTTQSCQFYTSDKELGNAQELLTGEIVGEHLQIILNYNYVLDSLNLIDTEKVVLNFCQNNTPGIIREEGSNDLTYLIQPINPS